MNLRTKVSEVKTKMKNGLSYEDAKKELQPHIDIANAKAEKLAKQFGMKHKKFTFAYLMR